MLSAKVDSLLSCQPHPGSMQSTEQQVCAGTVKKEKEAKLPRWKTRTAEQYIAHRHNQHKYRSVASFICSWYSNNSSALFTMHPFQANIACFPSMHREREKQRLQELSLTLHDLSFKMQEQAVQDAENDFLEEECEHLQKLLEEKNQELAAIQNVSSASDSQSASPGVPSAASAIDSDTDMTDLQSGSVPLDPELGLKDHKAMHEAYQFVVSCDVRLCIASETRLLGTDLRHNPGGKTCTSTQKY